jgi:hypothetical protein
LKSSVPTALASASPATIAMDRMGGGCLAIGGACLEAHEAIKPMNTRNFGAAVFIADLLSLS